MDLYQTKQEANQMTIFHKRLQILHIVAKTQRGSQLRETQNQIRQLEAKLGITKAKKYDIVSHDDNISYTRAMYRNTKQNNIRPLCGN